MTDNNLTGRDRASATQDILRIGTRGSPLALVQARAIAGAVEAASKGALRGEIVTFTTTGDQLTTERLINAGGKGLFTKEIDAALEAGDIDIGVHSLKDVPTALSSDHYLVCMPERADPREGFLSPHASALADLAAGATVGTASLRREAQTLAARPDIKIVTFRGNVDTRRRKLEEGLADATYLAMAGLARLGLAHLAHPVALDEMLPAAAQGIVGVTAKPGALGGVALAALGEIDHGPTRAAAIAERAFLAALDGSCRTPIAAHLFADGHGWLLRGEVLSVDGAQRWTGQGRVSQTADMAADRAALEALGQRVGDDIRAAAGGKLPAFTGE